MCFSFPPLIILRLCFAIDPNLRHLRLVGGLRIASFCVHPASRKKPCRLSLACTEFCFSGRSELLVSRCLRQNQHQKQKLSRRHPQRWKAQKAAGTLETSHSLGNSNLNGQMKSGTNGTVGGSIGQAMLTDRRVT